MLKTKLMIIDPSIHINQFNPYSATLKHYVPFIAEETSQGNLLSAI